VESAPSARPDKGTDSGAAAGDLSLFVKEKDKNRQQIWDLVRQIRSEGVTSGDG
jgi:hypothetical protein